MNNRELIIKILEENGMYLSGEMDEELDMDSLTFISIIVCLEQQLNICFPDDLLLMEKYATLNDFINNCMIIAQKTE